MRRACDLQQIAAWGLLFCFLVFYFYFLTVFYDERRTLADTEVILKTLPDA